MDLIKTVKQRLEAKGWDFSSDYWDDEELTSLHDVIIETEAALRQPPVGSQVCGHKSIMYINSQIGWLCFECRKFSNDKQTYR